MKEISEDLKYIKKFSKITISRACKELNVDVANLSNGKTTKENEKRVRKYLERELAKIYLEETDTYV
jgi:hypothetical protein